MTTVEVFMRMRLQSMPVTLSRPSHSKRRCHRVLAGWTVILALILIPAMVGAQEGWQVGSIVGLRAGTCIREGPGFSYRAHTRVPEDNWAVMVIDGPRRADGRIWWDTSRRAAGDPSGGTGWVTQDQTDTDCPLAASIPISKPSPPSSSGLVQQLLELLRRQSTIVKIIIAVLAVLILRVLWRSLSHLVTGLIGAGISALLIYILMDLTRFLWQGLWHRVAGPIFGSAVPDLALVLALLPLASWGWYLVRKWLSR
jgi:hypothetical protein